MMYVDFSVNGKDYKLRLNTRNVVVLEKQLGCNPLAVFGDGDQIPTLTNMVAILHASLQSLQHGISMDDAYDIFDAYLAEGHNMVEFIQVIVNVYKVSGLIKNDEVEDPKK